MPIDFPPSERPVDKALIEALEDVVNNPTANAGRANGIRMLIAFFDDQAPRVFYAPDSTPGSQTFAYDNQTPIETESVNRLDTVVNTVYVVKDDSAPNQRRVKRWRIVNGVHKSF